MRVIKLIKDFFLKPSHKIGLGILVVLGFIAGAISWQKFNDVMDATSTEEFCISCHSMQQPFNELKNSPHWSNTAGVTATCSDCHLPHDKTAKFARKMQASREVLAELMGKYKEEGSFEKHRLEMAEREWKRFAANGSKECKNCHSYERMNFENMSLAAQKAMKPAAERNQSCIDCHKGIAHHKPVQNENNITVSKFENLVITSLNQGNTYYTKGKTELFFDEKRSQHIGQLETAVPVTFIKSGEEADLVELYMWRKAKGFGRIWYNAFGKNIVDAIMTKDFMQNAKFEVIESKEDPLTSLVWQHIKLQVWIPKSSLIEDINTVWNTLENTYKEQCSICHRQPDVAHFDANSWIGLFNGMVGFTNMDKATSKEVLRYLQLHSSDFQSHKKQEVEQGNK